MLLTTGVDMTESRSRTKEANSSMVRGVAGLNIATTTTTTTTTSASRVTASYSRPSMAETAMLESLRCDPEVDTTQQARCGHWDLAKASITTNEPADDERKSGFGIGGVVIRSRLAAAGRTGLHGETRYPVPCLRTLSKIALILEGGTVCRSN